MRMVLSGVARTQARVACGKNVIAQMLCGSASAKVKKLNFDKLSTYGLLKHLKQGEVVMLIEALVAVGLLEQSEFDRFRPVVELTEAGAEVMRGTAPLDVALPIPDELLWKIRYATRDRKKRQGRGRRAVETGGRKGEGGGRRADERTRRRALNRQMTTCGTSVRSRNTNRTCRREISPAVAACVSRPRIAGRTPIRLWRQPLTPHRQSVLRTTGRGGCWWPDSRRPSARRSAA